MMLQRRLVGFVRDAPAQVALTIAAGLGAVGCLVGQGFLIAHVVRSVLDGAEPAEFTAPLVAVVLLAILQVALGTAKDLAATWTGAIVKRRVRHRLMTRMMELGPGATATRRTGEIQATIGDGVEALQAYVGSYVPQAVVAIVAPVSLVGFMITLDPAVGVIVAVGALAVPISQPLWRKVLGERGRPTGMPTRCCRPGSSTLCRA